MNIEIVLAYPDRQYLATLWVDTGTTLRQAAVHAFEQGLIPQPEEGSIEPQTVPLGVFGESEEDAYVLSEGERIEIYRPLLQDPKEWRRARARAAKAAQ